MYLSKALSTVPATPFLSISLPAMASPNLCLNTSNITEPLQCAAKNSWMVLLFIPGRTSCFLSRPCTAEVPLYLMCSSKDLAMPLQAKKSIRTELPEQLIRPCLGTYTVREIMIRGLRKTVIYRLQHSTSD